MSSYQQRDNSGSLFKNEGDRKRENGPDYSGTAIINGVEHFMDAWLKTSENGRRWMSFSFKVKTKQGGAVTQDQSPRARAARVMDDAPPF